MTSESVLYVDPDPSGPSATELVASGCLPAAVLRPLATQLPSGSSSEDLRGRFQGCLLGSAIGDALGRAGEGFSLEAAVSYHGGPLRSYVPWPGWKSGPVGTITDDTQMTMCIAESIVANGRTDPTDIGRRFAGWLDYGRGKGRTCGSACLRLRAGMPWYESGIDSAGNGAAMRTAPIGLLRWRSLDQLRLDAALACLITHSHPTAIASAIAMSAGVAYCLGQDSASYVPDRFIEFVVTCIQGIEETDMPERRPGGSRTTLAKRIEELPGLLRLPDSRAVYDYLYNGAFVLESLPTAMYAFLRNHHDFEATLFAAVDAGYDCDTSAAMAGALAGALLGRAQISQRWLDELEFRDELIRLADGLYTLSTSSGANAA